MTSYAIMQLSIRGDNLSQFCLYEYVLEVNIHL